jgi:hypothetical protein
MLYRHDAIAVLGPQRLRVRQLVYLRDESARDDLRVRDRRGSDSVARVPRVARGVALAGRQAAGEQANDRNDGNQAHAGMMRQGD